MQDVFAYIDQNRDRYIAMLQRMVRQPSVAAQGRGMAEMVEILRADLSSAGVTTTLHETGGAPVVVGDMAGASPKVLGFYNHYDVQPEEPLELWEHDPWGAEIIDGRIWGRGVADNKGNLAARIAAVDAVRAVRGELPLAVRFIVEGEEEIGSTHLPVFTSQHADLCKVDACLWEFGGTNWEGQPLVHLGVKGICYVELRVRGAREDQHSATATSVPNPAWRLVWALSMLKDQNERVLIPGFYDRVEQPTKQEMEVLARIPNNEAERLKHLDLDRFLLRATGTELSRRDYFEPTCTICGIESGYTGPGSKTVLPAKAMAKIDFRLVPNQEPEEIAELLRVHLDSQGFGDIEVHLLGPEHPAKTPLDAPIAQVVVDTYRELHRAEPVVIPIAGGSGPWWELCTQFGVDSVTVGTGHPRSGAHGPNENIYVEDFVRGIKHIAMIMDRFAK